MIHPIAMDAAFFVIMMVRRKGCDACVLVELLDLVQSKASSPCHCQCGHSTHYNCTPSIPVGKWGVSYAWKAVDWDIQFTLKASPLWNLIQLGLRIPGSLLSSVS